MTMNILIQDFCNSFSESPLPKIKSKAEKSFCLTKPDARSSGGEEDWLASGHLADGDIKYDLHFLYDVLKKEDQYKTEATKYKEQRCKVLFAHTDQIASN